MPLVKCSQVAWKEEPQVGAAHSRYAGEKITLENERGIGVSLSPASSPKTTI